MKSPIGFCAVAAFAAAGFLSTPATNAQQQSPPTTAPEATSPTNIPDHKLDAVAAAAKRVVAVSDRYEEKMTKAPAGEKEKIVGEANEAITKAVTDQGLSIEEYVSIMKMAQNDPSVRDRLVQRLK
jgi:Domain of unknown function (DUF4168)